MQKKLYIVAILATLPFLLLAQRRANPAKQLDKAPASGYVLLSDVNNELQFARLDTLTTQTQSTNSDTITQAAHGFAVGTLVGYNGAYIAANTADANNFPVAFVYEVISVNSFVIRCEGWLQWTHGQLTNKDYYLRDNGSFSDIPDTDYNIFAFRAFAGNKAYFDIPELIVSVVGGGTGGTMSFTVSGNAGTPQTIADSDVLNLNGVGVVSTVAANTDQVDILLSPGAASGEIIRTVAGVAGWHPPFVQNAISLGANNEIELGGSTIKSTTVFNDGFNLLFGDDVGDNVAYFRQSATNNLDLFTRDNIANQESSVHVINSGTTIETNGPVNNSLSQISSGLDNISLVVGESAIIKSSILLRLNGIYLTGITEYADDAAADADATLTSGGLYKVVGDRSIRIKP